MTISPNKKSRNLMRMIILWFDYVTYKLKTMDPIIDNRYQLSLSIK